MNDDPGDSEALLRAATNAKQAGDWTALLDIARQLQGARPGNPEAYLLEAEALVGRGDHVAANAVLERAIGHNPRNVPLAVAYAELPMQQGNPEAAIHRWESAWQRFPKALKFPIGAARAYRAAGRPQEAERILDKLAANHPGNFFILLPWAEIAIEQHDWRRAVDRMASVRAKFPHHPRSYIAGSLALRQLRRFEEADALTLAGLARHPDNVELMVSYATNASRKPDWAAAETRWRALLAKHPAAIGYSGLADIFARQGRPDDAEKTVLEGLQKLPGNIVLAEKYASLAAERADWPAAAARWQGFVRRFPKHGTGHQQLARALNALGKTAEADRALAAGVALVPDFLPLALDYALSAQATNDWKTAVRRWTDLDARFPNKLEVKEGLLQAKLGAAASGTALDLVTTKTDEIARTNSDQPEDVFAQFESLGENCEFGLVQRQYGLEPISVFRWVSLALPGLIHCLEDRLQDIGNPQHTELVVHPPATEYFVRDTFYRFGMHSFVKKGSIQEDRFYEQQCRRLRFLGRKFIEDLESGERIFVHFRKEETSAMQLQRLHRAIRSFGNTTLLFVKLADASHKPGTVEPADEGLMIGYIDRFGKIPPVGWDIAFDTWLAVCRNALDLRKKLSAL